MCDGAVTVEAAQIGLAGRADEILAQEMQCTSNEEFERKYHCCDEWFELHIA